MDLIGDFAKALGQLVSDRRFQWVVMKALILTVALLAAVTAGVVWSVSLLPDPLFTLPWIGPVSPPLLGAQTLALGGMLIASSFLMFPVAALFLGLFLDKIADAVEERHYPGLPMTRRPGLLEGLRDGIGFALTLIAANALALMLYLLLAPLAPVIFYALNGYLLGREFFQMTALRHSPPPEARRLRRTHRWRIWIAGLLIALPLSVPLLNLLVPVLGLATICHQYHRLTRHST
ncbi:MAG: EI24 domain-containing protein [Pseudomonadota bacterium]